MQALELHADEFATRYCVGELLWGHDSVGDLAGPDINLVERLVIFSLACCVFGVMWASAEQRYQPGMSFYPKRAPLDSDEPETLYALYPTSQAPAALRYMRFREFQGDLAMQYAMRKPGATTLGVAIDSPSRLVLYELAKLDPRFYRLLADTPGISKTPEVKRLIAYEAHLLKIGAALRPGWDRPHSCRQRTHVLNRVGSPLQWSRLPVPSSGPATAGSSCGLRPRGRGQRVVPPLPCERKKSP